MPALGFEKTDKPCTHEGNWGADTIAGFALRLCSNCGRTWVMIALGDGGFAWEVVSEPEETKDVSGVGQAVQSMPADQADEPVQPEPKPKRRSRSSVSHVQKELEQAAATTAASEV